MTDNTFNKDQTVTIGVITYNSSTYIIQTLNSLLTQTYQHIELIISDDCSTDNTPYLINKWLSENSSKFDRAIMLSTPRNLGVAGNCNNVFKHSCSRWIKILSGDDQLTPDCISEFYKFVENDATIKICGCKFRFISDISERYLKKMSTLYEDTYYPFLKGSLKYQKKKSLSGYIVPVAGPCTFISKELWELVGGFDEKYPFAEEEPFYFRAIYAGYKIHFLEKELYIYNFRAGSLGHEHHHSNINRFQLCRMKYYFDERFQLKLKHGYWFDAINTYLTYKADIAQRLGKKNTHLFFTILRRCSPYMIFRYIEYRKGRRYDKI